MGTFSSKLDPLWNTFSVEFKLDELQLERNMLPSGGALISKSIV
jgi:hypothetical protein